ncbi:MAG TPA: EutN/CcmL family microcompartment protein [Candidatus Wallbacteria bacterium]|nr:EutN/CcmL family microcompartment protein [Candidatus Wallbacteria bacterium]
MILGKVIGNVVSTIKNKTLEGFKLMLVKQTDISGNPVGKPLVAVDSVDAGEGDLVLILKEGGSAKIVLKRNKMPVNLVIVGVVDTVDLDGWVEAK